MRVKNHNKGTILSKNCNKALSFSDRLLGMLKKSNLGGCMFKTRFGIHTFFMKNPIDTIVLDNKYRVVKLATVKPNRLFFWNPRCSLILELPLGTIQKTKTEVGDIFKFSS